MGVLTDRETIRQRVLEELGGFVTTVASSPDDTSLILTDFKNRFADDNALKNWRLYLPDDDAADMERYITSWDDSAADATVEAMSDAATTGDVVEIYPPGTPTHHEINQGINRALQELRRVTWTAIPTIKGARRYGEQVLPWVRDKNDIRDVNIRLSPNLVANEDFESWGNGTSPELVSWTLAGTSSITTRISGNPQLFSPYGVRTTRSGTDATLTQVIGLLRRQLIGEAISASVVCVAGAASTARIGISDGASTSYSSYHSGGGAGETLTVSHTVAATATTLSVILSHETNDGDVDWDRVIATEGAIPQWLTDYGSENAKVRFREHDTINTTQGAAIIFRAETGRGQQVWVQSLQPYAPLTTDAAVTDCPLDAMLSNAVVRLARRRRPGQNRELLDLMLAQWTPTAGQWVQRLRSSASMRQERQVLRGA